MELRLRMVLCVLGLTSTSIKIGSSDTMKATRLGLQTMISVALVLLGLYVVCGWALVQGSMVQILPGSVAMGFNSALMFIVARLCLFPPNGNRTLLALLFIGFSALLGYTLDLEGMYRIAKYNQMAAPTAAAITLIGIALWLHLPRALSSREIILESPDKHIAKVAAFVLTVVAPLTGLVGFGVLKPGFEQSMADALLRTTKNYTASFSTSIKQQTEYANIIATCPALQKNSVALRVVRY